MKCVVNWLEHLEVVLDKWFTNLTDKYLEIQVIHCFLSFYNNFNIMPKISKEYLHYMFQAFSSENEFNEFISYCQKPIKKSIKINLHKISVEDFVNDTENDWRKLSKPNFQVDKKYHVFDDIFYVDRDNTNIPLGKTFYHQSWFFYIQEISAWTGTKFLFNPIKDNWTEIVLDISASPGWKSVQIWDYLQYLWEKTEENWKKNLWIVISNDINKSRIITLSHNLNRMWIFNSVITNFNWITFGDTLPEFFDKVLLDAPCSGEWIGFKSDEWLKYRRSSNINKISKNQYELLCSAIKTLKVGWTLIFSTCTMNPYENEFNIKNILKEYKWIIELENIDIIGKSNWLTKRDNKETLTEEQSSKIARFWPHIQKTWGFFIAKFKKIKTTSNKIIKNKLKQNNYKIKYDKKLQQFMKDFLQKYWWIQINDKKYLFVEDINYVYITSPTFSKIKDYIHTTNIWVPIFKKDRKSKIWPIHFFGIIFWHIATKNFIQVNKQSAQKYANWNNLEKTDIDKESITNPYMNYIIIKYKTLWIWIWKILNWEIKNKYIK